MGQSCFSIMLAVNAPRTTKHEVADRIYNVASNYEEAPACLNENLLGIEIAVGGSGRGGAADFNYTTVDLTAEAIENHRDFKKYIKRARKLWPGFVAHMESYARVKLKGEPRLVLTMTETA